MLFSKYLFFLWLVFIFLSGCSKSYTLNYTPKEGYKTGDSIILSNTKNENNSDIKICFSDNKHNCSSILYHYFANSQNYTYKILLKKGNKVVQEYNFKIEPQKHSNSFYIPNSSVAVFNGFDYFSLKSDILDSKTTTKKNEHSYFYIESNKIDLNSEKFYLNSVKLKSDIQLKNSLELQNDIKLQNDINLENSIKLSSEEINKDYLQNDYGKFLNKIEDFDFYYFGNFYRVINDNSIVSISENYTDKKLELFSFPLPNIESQLTVHEKNPLYFKEFLNLLTIDFRELKIAIDFDKIYSYWIFLSQNSLKKEFFNTQKDEKQWFVIFQFREFDDILDIKNSLSKQKEGVTFSYVLVHNKTVYSSSNSKIYIFFKEDKVCIGYNVNPLYLLEYIDKIPLSKGYNKNHFGYLKVENSKYIDKIIEIFPALKFLKNIPQKLEYSFWR